MSVRFRIVGTDLPGLSCTRAQGLDVDRENVHVGLQRGGSVVDLVPGDASSALFELEVDVKAASFASPFVHGQRGERFFYLSWGEVAGDGEFTMFRRAKLQLDGLDAAALDGTTVEGRLRLSDAAGGPICASIRPPAITWAAGTT
jgi:hypothetical protein